MIFTPRNARAVLNGEKTVTRRLCSENPRSPWWLGECRLKPGSTASVQMGRGKPTIGVIRVRSVEQLPLGVISDTEAKLEGFESAAQFRRAFGEINDGDYDPTALVWRIEFERV